MAAGEMIAVPQWTVLGKKRGVDPLGMQNSSVRIYQRLLPGISNVTLRVRYYGLYVWLADRYARDIGDGNTKTWQRRVRRAEALYALIAGVKGDETGVAGAEWASSRLAVAKGVIDFRDDTEPDSDTHYLANPWGVFGQAYQSQLFAIGVFADAADHDIPTPAPGLGDELARAFGDATGEEGKLFLRALDRGTTSRKELERLVTLAPSSIGRGRERDCYRKMLFGHIDRPEAHETRTQTLRLILHWAQASKQVPSAGRLRWSMYSGHLDGATPWEVNGHLEQHRLRWAVYQANEIVHVALETLLRYLLDRLEAHKGGVALPDLIGEVASRIVECFDDAVPSSWAAYVESVGLTSSANNADDPASELALTALATSPRGEAAIWDDEHCLAAIRALAAVQKRATPWKGLAVAELGDLDPSGFRSMLTEFEFLEGNADVGFREFLQRLFLDRVVRRHQWVAMRKLRYQSEYTFLMDFDEGLVRLRTKDRPVWTGPRLGNAITFLKDIGMLGNNGITALGRRELEAS